ncbi:MAG: MFS transporter [Chloroflexi bacterium]|nr:MFS transporter [Chloroflexota bacterium]
MSSLQSSRRSFWQRSLEHYPSNNMRIWYLFLAVIATIVLYYQYFVLPSVVPLVMQNIGLSLPLFGLANIIITILGGVSALFAGLSDRFGRANLIVFGLVLSSLITFVIALTTSVPAFLLVNWVLGFVEGVIFTITSALVRDFSPRMGRGLAMGFWTIGPTVGQVVATFVTSQTLHTFGTWQSQFVIAGITGLVVALICFFGLRELSPELRGQVITTLEETKLAEERAQNTNVAEAMKHPWRQMLRSRVLVAALGIAIFMTFYFSAALYFPTYLTKAFPFTLDGSNRLMSIFNIIDVIGGVLIGFLSDRFIVRKPFMLGGTLVLILTVLFFISRIGQPISFVLMSVILGIFGFTVATVWVSWFAGFSEMLEDINPSLVGTGLGIAGFVQRTTTTVALLALTLVVGNGQGFMTWWWVCIACLVVFIPTIFVNAGFWSPARARAKQQARLQAEGLGARLA